MPIDWDAHLLAPLHEVFGDKANFRPKNAEAYDIVGVFDRAYTRDIVTLEGDIEVNTTSPVLGVRDVQFKAPPCQGDRVYVYAVGTLYAVKDVQPDSHGATRLELNEVKL